MWFNKNTALKKYLSLLPVLMLLFQPVFSQVETWSTSDILEPGTSVEHLGAEINSVYDEYYPVISPDGKTLYFSRDRHPQNMGTEDAADVWVSYLQDDYFWSKPVNLGPPVNNSDANIPVGISLDGETLYLSGNYYTGDPYTSISISRKSGRFWSAPEPMIIRNFMNRDRVASYHVSPDGNVLLMSVRMEESYGERDIYVAFRENTDTWSVPKNLGPRINTLGTETGAFLAADNETIYFYSNGHDASRKGFLLYKSSRLDDSWSRWSEILPLDNYVTSTCSTCFASLTADANGLFFSHQQQDNVNEDIMKIFALPKDLQPRPLVQVKGQVVSSLDGSAVSARVKAQSLTANAFNSTVNTSTQGEFTYMLPYGQHIGLFAEVDGFFAPGKYAELNPDDLHPLDYDADLMSTQPERVVLQKKIANSEMEALQLVIDSLDREVALLEREREKHKFLPVPAAYQTVVPVSTSELERLRLKYQKMAAPTGAIIGDSAPSAAKADNSNPALKKKYDTAYQTSAGTAPKSSNQPASTPDELAKLKSKYGSYYGVEPAPAPVTAPKAVIIDSSDLVLYKKLLKQELSKEWTTQVKTELREQYIDEVAKELEKNLDEKSRKMLNKTVKDQAKSQLKYQGLAQTRQEVEDSDHPVQNQVQVSPFEEELRNLLREEVKNQLMSSLEEPVRKEIQTELKYILTKNQRDQYRLALQNDIQVQMKAENESTVNPNQLAVPVALPPQRTSPFLAENKNIRFNLELYPLKSGQVIPLHNIFFDFNSSRLREESFPELNRIVKLMQRYPGMIIEINVHTNGQCSHGFANSVTTERARKIAGYLSSLGINSSRVRFNGFGKTAPVRSNDTEEGRQANQRIEMKVVAGI